MTRKPISNVYHSTSPLYRILKLFGIACFTIVPLNSTTKVTGLDIVLFILNTITTTALTVLCYSMRTMIGDSLIHAFGLKFLFCFSYMVKIATSVYVIVWQRRQLAAILLGLHRTDADLNECGVRVRHERNRRVVLCIVVGLSVYNAAIAVLATGTMCLVCGAKWWMTIAMVFNNFFLSMGFSCVELAYGIGLLGIQQRMHLLNSAIGPIAMGSFGIDGITVDRWCDRLPRNVISGPRFIPTEPSKQRIDRIKAIRRLRHVQLELTRLADACNVYFAWPVLAMTGVTFGHILFYILGIYTVIYSQHDQSFRFAMMLTLWVLIYVMQLLAIVCVGSRLAKTGRQTGGLVHAALNGLRTAQDRELSGELLLFGQQVLHNFPVASCGLFLFDWTLVYSVRVAGGWGNIRSSSILPFYRW